MHASGENKLVATSREDIRSQILKETRRQCDKYVIPPCLAKDKENSALIAVIIMQIYSSIKEERSFIQNLISNSTFSYYKLDCTS